MKMKEMKAEQFVGRQYGSHSSAKRAIRQFKKQHPKNRNCWWTNQIDDGCIEIDGDVDQYKSE